MKIEITRYKQTGKFYDIIEVISENSTYFDDAAKEIVQKACRNWDGYATVGEIQKDGFVLPMRLLTRNELILNWKNIYEDRI